VGGTRVPGRYCFLEIHLDLTLVQIMTQIESELAVWWNVVWHCVPSESS